MFDQTVCTSPLTSATGTSPMSSRPGRGRVGPEPVAETAADEHGARGERVGVEVLRTSATVSAADPAADTSRRDDVQRPLPDVHVRVPEAGADEAALEIDDLEVVEPEQVVLRDAERPDAAVDDQHVARASAPPRCGRCAGAWRSLLVLPRVRPSTAAISAASSGCE